MRRFISRGVVAMEEETGEEVAVADDTAPATAEAAQDELEVNEAADVVEDGGDAIEEGTEVAATLEVAAEALAISVKNGGIDKHAAAAIGALTQHLYSRVGLRARAMPAMESFGGTSTRIGATQLALEGIKEGVKEIWKSIVAALKKMVAWVKGYWNKFFGGAESLVKRAESLKKAAEGASSKKLKSGAKVEDAGLIGKLYIDKTFNPANLAAELTKVGTAAKAVLTTNATAVLGLGEAVVKAIEGDAAAGLILPAGAGAKVDGAKYGLEQTGTKWVISDEMLGGVVHVQRQPETESKDDAALAMFGKVIDKFVSKADSKKPTQESAAPLDATKVDAVASVVITIGNELVAFRKTQTRLDDLLAKAAKAAESASKAADGDDSDVNDEAAKTSVAHGKAMREAAKNLSPFLVNRFVSATKYPYERCQAALSYCDKSLKCYE